MAIPVASFGTKAEFAGAISDGLLPEFDGAYLGVPPALVALQNEQLRT
jgi:hypothetical protein